MSTSPNGWQDPKMNWQPPDPVGVSDFNRIEGNVNAIEQGSRTLDPAQAPTGNVGTLRQILDWFANRIKAITGKANWYDAPDTTLAAAKSHFDAQAPHPGHAVVNHDHDGIDSPNVPWNNVSGKPSTFPPSSHTHSGSDITSAVANASNSDKLDGVDATAFAENVATVNSKRAGYAVYAP